MSAASISNMSLVNLLLIVIIMVLAYKLSDSGVQKPGDFEHMQRLRLQSLALVLGGLRFRIRIRGQGFRD